MRAHWKPKGNKTLHLLNHTEEWWENTWKTTLERDSVRHWPHWKLERARWRLSSPSRGSKARPLPTPTPCGWAFVGRCCFVGGCFSFVGWCFCLCFCCIINKTLAALKYCHLSPKTEMEHSCFKNPINQSCKPTKGPKSRDTLFSEPKIAWFTKKNIKIFVYAFCYQVN